MAYLVVFVGSGIGGMLRHWINVLVGHLLGPGLPFGTFGLNVVGSLLMGFLVGLLGLGDNDDHGLRLFLATGMLGGFTTFSTFSLEVVTLLRRGDVAVAAAYASASLIVSLGALALALHLVRRLF